MSYIFFIAVHLFVAFAFFATVLTIIIVVDVNVSVAHVIFLVQFTISRKFIIKAIVLLHLLLYMKLYLNYKNS